MGWSLRPALGFFALGLIVLAALNIGGRLPVSGPTEPQIMRAKFAAVDGKDAVSLGGSTTTAIDFDAMCVDGAELWNNGQDLFETEALVDLILTGADPPGSFVLVLGPGAILHDNGMPVRAGTYRRRFTYRFLQGEGRWGLIGDDWRQAFLAQAMPAIGDELRQPWHGALLRYLNKVPPVDARIDTDTRHVEPAEADALAAVQMASWDTVAKDTAYDDPYVARRTRDALLRIASSVRSAGAQLVVVVPPYIPQLARRMQTSDTGMLGNFERALRDAEGEGAVVMRYWDDVDTWSDYALFRDATHLNEPGSKVFSRQLARDLAIGRVLQRNIGKPCARNLR